MTNEKNQRKNDHQLGHGQCLSELEYEKQIVSLYSKLPPKPDKFLAARTQRCELDLAIDHKLGRQFPRERRDALWKIHEEINNKRPRLIFYWLWHAVSYKWLHKRADKLAEYLVKEYDKVLTPLELKAFFDLQENERPTLPIDFKSMK